MEQSRSGFYPKRWIAAPLRHRVDVEIGVGGQAMGKDFDRKAHRLHRVIARVIRRDEGVQIKVRGQAIPEPAQKIVIWAGRAGARIKAGLGQANIEPGRKKRRAVLLNVLGSKIGANLVFEAFVSRKPGNRDSDKAVLLGAEIASLAEGEETEILVIVHCVRA